MAWRADRLPPEYGPRGGDPQALPLLEGRSAQAVLADNGYDSAAIVASAVVGVPETVAAKPV